MLKKKKKQLSVKSVVFVRDKLLRHQPERNVLFGQFFLSPPYRSRVLTVFFFGVKYMKQFSFFWQIAALIYVYYLYFLTLFKILLFSLCEGLTWLT